MQELQPAIHNRIANRHYVWHCVVITNYIKAPLEIYMACGAEAPIMHGFLLGSYSVSAIRIILRPHGEWSYAQSPTWRKGPSRVGA